MKDSLAHLPENKRSELDFVTATLCAEFPDVQMIILFGSYARGDWVEDEYQEGHIVYTYESDFDVLVITETKHAANDLTVEQHDVERHICRIIKTPIRIIYHEIEHVNRLIERGRYFFTDIKKEGVLLYDSKRFELSPIREIDVMVRKENAEEDFALWFPKAKDFYRVFQWTLEQGLLNLAAFLLHQAAECAYTTIELVFSGYKPKLHDLEKLDGRAGALDTAFGAVFPRDTQEQRDLFDKLKKAYIDARYSADYNIATDELEYLAARVRELHRLTDKHCKTKIASFVP